MKRKTLSFYVITFSLSLGLGLFLQGCGQNQSASPQQNAGVQVMQGESREAITAGDEPAQESVPTAESAEGTQKYSADDLTLEQYLATTDNRSGKPLFVNFWASWCQPCREEMPHILELYEQYKDKIDFMAVSVDSVTGTEADLLAAMKEMNMTLPTFILQVDDQNTLISKIDEQWDGGLPMTLIYNPQGDKTQRMLGAHSKDEFKNALDSVLQG